MRVTDPVAYNMQMAYGQLMAFLTLGWASIIHIFTARSRKSAFATNFLKNKQMTFSALALAVSLAVLALIPVIHYNILYTSYAVMLNGWHWLFAFLLCFGPIIVAEYGKFWDNYKFKNLERTRVRKI